MVGGRGVCRGGGGNQQKLLLPKELSCISGGCLESCQGAKGFEFWLGQPGSQWTLIHLAKGTAIQTGQDSQYSLLHKTRNSSSKYCKRTPVSTKCYTVLVVVLVIVVVW